MTGTSLMKTEWRRLLVPAALLALLGVLATLQYRWIGGVSEAERARMRESVQARATQMAEEFDGEITRAYFTFLQAGTTPDPIAACAAQYTKWLSSTRHPRLIRGVFVRRFGNLEPALVRVTREGTLEPAEWPQEFGQWRERFRQATGARDWPVQKFLIGDLPVFSVPLMTIRGLDQPLSNVNVGFSGAVVGWLDREYLEKQYLPALAAKYFSSSDRFEYHVAVVAPRQGQRLVYVSDATLHLAAFARPDLKTTLLQVRYEEIGRAMAAAAAAAAVAGGMNRGATAARRRGGDEGVDNVHSNPDAGEWQLLLVHAAGSLERVIEMSRRRNLAISFGVVLLVAASLVSVTISTRRAQRLARQQVEFVAGVSHELRTPLSVIRAAGENLSDGVIAEPDRVRRYGAMIAEEGRHLSEMVEQVMSFAGFGSARDLRDRTERDVSGIVDAALARTRSLIERNGFTIERRIAPGLPPVRVNAAAMTQAIENLITNAVKYGGCGRWVRVCAERAVTPRGAGVCVIVEDRGIGIPPDEQRRVFEPFYRGRGVLGSTTRGSGLGLSLVKRIVEAHGGSIGVRSVPGEGSAFTVHLPVEAGGEVV